VTLAEPVAYAHRAAAAIEHELAADLVGCWLHGSAALGDFSPERSDVDLLAVCRRPLEASTRERLGAALVVLAAAGPGQGLELSIVTRESAQTPSPSPPFELHVASEGGVGRWQTDTGSGDPDLILHALVCRQAGIAIAGPPASEVLAEPPHALVLECMLGDLRWSLDHATTAYQVLNACRVLRFLDDGTARSKRSGGEWALARGGDRSIIEAAVAHHDGGGEAPDPAAAARLVRTAIGRLEATIPSR
jgi:hypothetical protein